MRQSDEQTLRFTLEAFLPHGFGIDASAGGFEPRELLQRALSAGFNDSWLWAIMLFAGQHSLYRSAASWKGQALASSLPPYAGEEHGRLKSMPGVIKGVGLEIGAFHNPLVHGSDVQVSYVDMFRPDVARRYYPEIRDVPIVEPDIVASADKLLGIGDNTQDFVVSSHLIEHLEDPIGALIEWNRVIKPGGWLYLRAPDRRGTFDRDRLATTLEHVVLDHSDPDGRSARDYEHYCDWARVVNKLDGRAAIELWASLLQLAKYPIHFHCWTPVELIAVVHHVVRAHATRIDVAEMNEYPQADDFEILLKKRL